MTYHNNNSFFLKKTIKSSSTSTLKFLFGVVQKKTNFFLLKTVIAFSYILKDTRLIIFSSLQAYKVEFFGVILRSSRDRDQNRKRLHASHRIMLLLEIVNMFRQFSMNMIRQDSYVGEKRPQNGQFFLQ